MRRSSWRERFVAWARDLRRDVVTLWMALRHPGTPALARAIAWVVVIYALSPIDLIPDFIPVLGYLDDMVLLPLGVWLAVRRIPPAVLAQCRQRAQDWLAAAGRKPVAWAGAALVIALWALIGLGLWRWLGTN